MRIAINGFGRIGRAAFKIIRERNDMEVVAINDLTDATTLAHLLAYDTAYGQYDADVTAREHAISVDGHEYPIIAEPDPARLPWSDYDVDVVLECTGRFVRDGAARAHITAGAKRVVLSAPAKGDGDVATFLMGVNHETLGAEHDVVSNASCTTNCIAPVAEIMHSTFGVQKAMMTTIHSYTADQRLQDAPHRDLRRARAAAQNIVPTTTGAALATAKVIPALDGKFDGMSVRVPTIVVSLADFTFVLQRDVTVDDVNSALTHAAQNIRYKDVLAVTDKPLVSSDFIGVSYSSVVDLAMTKVVDGNMVKVVAWYDNEQGYAHRLVDMAGVIHAHA